MHSLSEDPRQHSVLLMQSPSGLSIAEQLQSDEQSHKCSGNVSAASCGLHTVTNYVHNTQGASSSSMRAQRNVTAGCICTANLGVVSPFMMYVSVCSPAEALVVLGHGKAHLLLHVHTILAGTSLNEGPVKEVTIVGDIHTWFHLQRVDRDCLCLKYLLVYHMGTVSSLCCF